MLLGEKRGSECLSTDSTFSTYIVIVQFNVTVEMNGIHYLGVREKGEGQRK
jgi:hypothetical protein